MAARLLVDAPLGAPAAPCAPTLQRKVEFRNPSEPDSRFVHERLQARRDALVKQDERDKLAKLSEQHVAKALERLRKSPISYGRFDLERDEDLAFLFHEVYKHVEAPRHVQDEPEREVRTAGARAARERLGLLQYLGKSPNPDKTYDLALLGTGASIAYWITSNKHSLDPLHTVVIGNKQPWAEERGPGVVNHPLHMITAIREEVGLGDQALLDREEFSRIVERVISENVMRRVDAGVTKVEKVLYPRPGKDGRLPDKINEGDRVWLYAIQTMSRDRQETYYARRVVAGLGIGGHAMPRPRRGVEDEQGTLGGRAMNMDEFQRRAASLRADVRQGSDLTIVISGPNAGIDAVTTAMRHGFKIIWVTSGGRPGFLPGTDNEIVAAEYDLWMNPSTRATSKIHHVVQKYGYLATLNDDPQAFDGKPIVVDTDERKFGADYYVWAMGPDVGAVRRIFGDQFVNLELAYDVNRQFGAEGPVGVVGLQSRPGGPLDRSSLQIIGGAAYRLAENVPYTYVSDQHKQAKVAAQHVDEIHRRFDAALADVAHAAPVRDAATRLRAASEKHIRDLDSLLGRIASAADSGGVPAVVTLDVDGDLDLVGAFGKTAADKAIAGLASEFWHSVKLVRAYGQLLAAFGNEVRAYLAVPAVDRRKLPDPRKAWGQMAKVTGSLPGNVLINDQLTPTRSQIEAGAAFVPDYVRDEVNFATDSATVLAIHIAVKYPNIPDRDVDRFVEQIIAERKGTQDPLDPGPVPNPRAVPQRADASHYFTKYTRLLEAANSKGAS